MFERLFKKTPRGEPAGQARHGAAQVEATQPKQVASSLPDDAQHSETWRARIAAAGADDAALLQLAREAPGVELKIVALEALTQEDALKQAMREFRERDKRLYRTAKLRCEAMRDQRLARSEAHSLIAEARTLLEQAQIPANRLVEVDQRWRALNSGQLDAALPQQFADLSAQLSAKVRAHGERVRAAGLWVNAIDGAAGETAAMLSAVARGDAAPAALETLLANLTQLLGVAPESSDSRCSERIERVERQRGLAAAVAQRATFLQALPAGERIDQTSDNAAVEGWRTLPELAGEEPLRAILAQRFDDWRAANIEARKRAHDARRSAKHAQREQNDRQRIDNLHGRIEAAEAAHAEGRVAELADLLTAIEQALKGSRIDAALTQRVEVLRREHARLEDWKRWSGGLGREQLVADAQALQRLAGGKVDIKAHGDAINKLRERWKELDKLGGASNQSLWQSFDGALKAAYEPVAAHVDKLKQARLDNLAAREQIVAQLAQAATQYFPPTPEDIAPAAAQPDWRAVARTLEQTRIAWQKLGPVEHTIPRAALQGETALTARYAAAMQALEEPLNRAYDSARAQREKLVRTAGALGAGDVSARDVVDKVRKLQSQWQAAAKALPLPRRDENALWLAFKQATDAIFSARDAARSAQEAESSAQIKAREEIVDRLAAVPVSASAAEIKRALADADSAWRTGTALAKPLQGLNARYDAARDACARRLSELAAHAAQARFDALTAALALCHERETLATDDMSGLESRWTAIAALPPAWAAALQTRFTGPPQPAPDLASSNAAQQTLSDALLNLEALCGIDSPSEFLAARQALKMRALKLAMEGRQAPAGKPADIEAWLLKALASTRPDALSRERLAKVIAALRLAAAR